MKDRYLSVFFYALAFQLSVTVSCAIPASIKLSNRLGQFKKKKDQIYQEIMKENHNVKHMFHL